MQFKTFPENINPFAKKGVVKLGIDPTGPELHLGHLLPIKLFKMFKEQGFEPHIILGTFTAQIGDATGRDTTRPILSAEETWQNAENILKQIKRILGDDIIVEHNSKWHNVTTLPDIMNMMSNFSVQQLLNRDNFSKRMDKNIPIGMHELMGPILQGIDSFMINTVVEIGGTDQLFNFMISREVQQLKGQEPEVCVFSPVINGTDGRKMSKSFGNCIFLNDTPQDVFGKAMSISDEMMIEWQPIFFDNVDTSKHPMVQKKELALQITKEIWGEELANRAIQHFENTIQHKEIPADIPEIPVGKIIEVVKTMINGSNSEARRLLVANAVRINGEKANETFELKQGDIVKVGKLKYAKVI